MKAIRNHAWVNIGGQSPPLSIPPNLDSSNNELASLVQSIYVDENLLVYTFHTLVSTSICNNPDIRTRSISAKPKGAPEYFVINSRRKSICVMSEADRLAMSNKMKHPSYDMTFLDSTMKRAESQPCTVEINVIPPTPTQTIFPPGFHCVRNIPIEEENSFRLERLLDNVLEDSNHSISGSVGKLEKQSLSDKNSMPMLTKGSRESSVIKRRIIIIDQKVIINLEEIIITTPMTTINKRMSMVGPQYTGLSISTNDTSVSSQTTEPEMEEITKWHIMHRPPKEIRMANFILKRKTSYQSQDPSGMFQDLHLALERVCLTYDKMITFERNTDYYIFNVKYVDVQCLELCAEFEAEIFKLYLSNCHQLKFKRIMGNSISAQDIQAQIIVELQRK
jgi:hypothetical protein